MGRVHVAQKVTQKVKVHPNKLVQNEEIRHKPESMQVVFVCLFLFVRGVKIRRNMKDPTQSEEE